MQNIAGVFLDYFRLERKRTRAGLSVRELERWSDLKERLERHQLREAGSNPALVRASVRVPTRLHCSFASRSDFDEAVITNLSTGGVFISTTSPLPIGDMLRLHMHVASTGARIEVEAFVVSNNVGPDLEPGVAGMGVRFSRVGADTIDEIHDLYERELARDAGERDDGDGAGREKRGLRQGEPKSAGSRRVG